MALGGNYVNFGEDQAEDMRAQAKAAARKRQESVTPGHFIAATNQTLREKRDKYQALKARHLQIRDNFDRARVGLHKLNSLPVKYQTKLGEVKDTLQNLVKDNQGIDYVLNRCKKILDETSVAAQMVGEGLKSKLGDRHKKLALQREIGLRLRDIDSEFARCHESLLKEEAAQKRLLTDLLQLLADSGKKLPPKIKKDMDHKGKLMEVVLEQQNRLRDEAAARVDKPSPGVIRKKAPAPLDIPEFPEKSLKGLGNFNAEDTEDIESTKTPFFNTRAGSATIIVLSAAIATIVLRKLG